MPHTRTPTPSGKPQAHLPGLGQPADGGSVEPHHDSKERVQVLLSSAAVNKGEWGLRKRSFKQWAVADKPRDSWDTAAATDLSLSTERYDCLN